MVMAVPPSFFGAPGCNLSGGFSLKQITSVGFEQALSSLHVPHVAAPFMPAVKALHRKLDRMSSCQIFQNTTPKMMKSTQ